MPTLSAKATERFEVGNVVYLITPATMLTRAAFRRDVSALGAVYHSDAALLLVLREAVEATVEDEQVGEMLEIIDSFEFETEQRAGLNPEDIEKDAQEQYEDLAQQVAQLEGFCRANSSRYARMESDRGYWLSVAPILAFKHFVTGWEGGDVPFSRRQGQVGDDLLEQLPEGHVEEVGWKILRMMQPSRGDSKNSTSQSSSQASPAPSTAEKNHRTAAKGGK